MDYTNDDKEIEARRKQDFDDLQNESAGRVTGRMRRFLTREERVLEARRKEKIRQDMRTLLQIALEDPGYLAAYDRVADALMQAQTAIDQILMGISLAISDAQQELDELEHRAAHLPDGTRVYRDANGTVRRADGSVVDDTLSDTILWSGDEPGFEEFQTTSTRLEQLEADRQDVLDYQNNIVGPAQAQMEDPDNPPSLDALNTVLKNLDNHAPEAIKATTSPPAEPRSVGFNPGNMALPKID